MWPRHWGGHKASDGVFGKDVVLVVWLVLYVCEGATKPLRQGEILNSRLSCLSALHMDLGRATSYSDYIM